MMMKEEEDEEEYVLGSESGTISSGSSGKRVIVPEPSRSIFCFISRILAFVSNSKDVLE